jgi:hypothetical protein
MLELVLARGGSALIEATDGDVVTLVAESPSPPGSTVELSRDQDTFRVKVRACRRLPAADDAGRCFRIEGRWVSLSRAQRERVLLESAPAVGRDDEP